MDAWATVVGTIAGAAIALAGQWAVVRGQRRTRVGELLLEQCARVVALNEDFRNRLWEERTLSRPGRVESWDLGAARLAAAQVRILCMDADVLAALSELGTAGRELGAYWRRGDIDEAELEYRYHRQKAAIEQFSETAAALVRHRHAGLYGQ
jgi:hypothetical protein